MITRISSRLSQSLIMDSKTDVLDDDLSALAPAGVLTKTEHPSRAELVLPKQLADDLRTGFAHLTTTGQAQFSVEWFVDENAPMLNLFIAPPFVSAPAYLSRETSGKGGPFSVHIDDSSHTDVNVLLTWLMSTFRRTSAPSEGFALLHSAMEELLAFCNSNVQTSQPGQDWKDCTDFTNALSDLRGAVDEATEEGYCRPSDDAVTEAERILRSLYEVSPRRFEVYPTQDGEIALDAPGDSGSVILLLEPHGGALCLVNVNGNHRRARYSSTTTLPDGFVREAVSELDGQGTTS